MSACGERASRPPELSESVAERDVVADVEPDFDDYRETDAGAVQPLFAVLQPTGPGRRTIVS